MSRHGSRGGTPLVHPFELAFCGPSGSGKTTLIEGLMRRMAPERRVGYVKHDAHGFHMDHEGKDTWRAQQAGAIALQIQSEAAWAARLAGAAPAALSTQLFSACDLVLMEGYRRELAIDKLLFIDGLQGEDAHERVLAVVTGDARLAGRPLPPGRAACIADLSPDLPVFHREDVEGIASWVLAHFTAKLAARPVCGLVLTGGRSRRMGRDKALLDFGGEPQAERAARLLDSVCAQVLISARAGQGRELLGRPVLADRFVDIGPMGGILTALEERPEAAWLVLGCDLPFVTPEVLDSLLAGRDPWRFATAFRDPASGLPEPLCAVWEPASRTRLLGALAAHIRCPRQALTDGANLLDLPDPRALENVNRPEELEAARARWEAQRASSPGGGSGQELGHEEGTT